MIERNLKAVIVDAQKIWVDGIFNVSITTFVSTKYKFRILKLDEVVASGSVDYSINKPNMFVLKKTKVG